MYAWPRSEAGQPDGTMHVADTDVDKLTALCGTPVRVLAGQPRAGARCRVCQRERARRG